MKHIAHFFRLRKTKPGRPSSSSETITLTPPVVRNAETPIKVILFIGHHKVGSATLQDYLSRNAVALARAGVLYPYVDFEGMAYMAAAATGHAVIPDHPLPPNIRTPHNALAFQMLADYESGDVPPWHTKLPTLSRMEHAIRQQVRFSAPHTVILAAEVFANFGAVSEDMIQRLAHLFPKAEFTIIATLRRIDDYLVSWQGQRLKFGHKLFALRDNGIDSYLDGIHFNYRLMIQGWLKQFPKADIILRNYSDVLANGGSVADFLAQTNIAVPADMLPEQRQNTSFHRSVYETLRRGNRELGPAKVEALHHLMHELPSLFDLPPGDKIEMFGIGNRQELLRKFKPIDTYLGQVTGRDGFFADLDHVLDPLDIPELDAHHAALASIDRIPTICEDQEVRAFLKKLNQEACL